MANTIPDNEMADGLPLELQRDTIPGPPPQECEPGDDMSWGEEPQREPRPSGTYVSDAEPPTERQGETACVAPLRAPRIGAC
jgi:hypothetical protein